MARSSKKDGGAPAPARRPRRQAPARPRQAQRREKQGTVTKAVQRRRGSQFLSEVIAELRKVSWPNRTQLAQGTAVVLVVVAIVATYLAVLDAIFSRVVDSIF
jgi:preprotein translocase subunit SecE